MMTENRGLPDLTNLPSALPAKPTAADYENLQRLRDILKALRLPEIRAWPLEQRSRGLVALFDCALAADVSSIKSNDGNVRDSLVALGDMINVLLSSLEPEEVISSAGAHLVGFLNHPLPVFRTIALDHVIRAAQTNELRSNPMIIQSCIICIGDEELSVAANAIEAVSSVAGTPGGLAFLFGDPNVAVNRLTELMGRSETVKFRVFEWAVKVSSKSEESLQRCADAGFLQKLMNEFKEEDVLSQLNAIQLLTDLTDTPQGFQYLDNQGILTLLEASLRAHDGPMASFVVPGLLKFFGHASARNADAVLYKYPGFVEAMFACMTAPDPTVQNVAMDTVAFIGASREGKLALQKNGMDRYIGALFRIVETGASEAKVQALETLARLISMKGLDEVGEGDEVTEITHSWFRLMQQNPLSKVVSLCNQPFPDIRNASLALLEAVASQKWGLVCLNSSPGMAEFLLDRGQVRDKEGKEAKFAIVSTIVDHPESMGIFGQVKMAAFRRHVREGPFYVAVQAEVAMEGE